MSFAISQEDVKGLAEDQLTAIVDALVVAAWADGSATPVEMQRFESEVGKLPWGRPVDQIVAMVQQSVKRVAAVKGDEAMKFISGVADRLKDQRLREKVLYTMGVITFADKQMADSERRMLSAFAETFQIPVDRVQAISAALRGA
jgi:uncharacterized tellurite resistance protein B-like protein